MTYVAPMNISGEAKQFLIEQIEKENRKFSNKKNKYKYYLLKVLKIDKNKYKYDLSFSPSYIENSKYVILTDVYSIIIDKNSEEHLKGLDILLKKTKFGFFISLVGYRKKSLCDCDNLFEYVLPIYNENQLELFEYKESDFKN